MNGHSSPASTNQGVECSMPAAHLKPKRQPITNAMLGQMLSQLDRDHKPSHDRLMLKAAITLGFFGLLRVIEFTVPNQDGFNSDHMYMYTCIGAKKKFKSRGHLFIRDSPGISMYLITIVL